MPAACPFGSELVSGSRPSSVRPWQSTDCVVRVSDFLHTRTMMPITRNRLQILSSTQNPLNRLHFRCASDINSTTDNGTLKSFNFSLTPLHKFAHHSKPFHSSLSSPNSTQEPVRARPRNHRKPKENPLNMAQFERCVAQLPPRFTSEDLYRVLAIEEDPYVCLELFNYASQQPRFRHCVLTYHIMVKRLGSAKLFDEMDRVVDQVLAVRVVGSEALFNTIIYFYTEDRKLTKAVNVYKHMGRSMDPGSRPSVKTYNLLFTSFLSRRSNTYINHMYMETIRCLFRQMVDDGIEPDIFSLNSMITGYVLSLHVNDALRIFHQMGAVYKCPPNAHSYDYLIHGLCCQGRTKNAKELYVEMKSKGFVPSAKAYNSLANSFAIGGEVEEAVRILWEMYERRRLTDFITYKTVLDEICRQGNTGEAIRLLNELLEKDLIDGITHRKLLHIVEDESGD